MDAVKFLEEDSRMCNTYNDCVGCPMKNMPFCYPHDMTTNDERKELVDAVEKWSKEHPIVTNGMKFKEYVPYDKISMSTDSPFVTIRVSRNWWDAECKEKSNGDCRKRHRNQVYP